MDTKIKLLPNLYFSYSQFMVFDRSVRLPGCAWTPAHTAQGFARRASTVNFNTQLEFGYGHVTVEFSAFEPSQDYQRVIAVPFLVVSGSVAVEGPEETTPKRCFALTPGNFRLTAAQRVAAEEEEVIALFFERLIQPLGRSEIIVKDHALNPPAPLIETCGIAGEG